MKRIAFIGGGNVAIAILGGLIAKGMGPEQSASMARRWVYQYDFLGDDRL